MHGPSHELPGKLQAAPIPTVINHTAWPAQYFQHVDPHGEGFHVMVSRMSYTLERLSVDPQGLLVPELLAPGEQAPLVTSDHFQGEPNASDLLQESDFAPYKPLCDIVLINAVAHSPQGQERQRWPVGLKFGRVIDKQIDVTGPWLLDPKNPQQPKTVNQVALSYERAFGGPQLLKERQWVEWLAEQAESPTQKRAQALLANWPQLHDSNPLGCGRSWQAAAALQQELAQLSSEQGRAPTPEQVQTAIDKTRRGPQLQMPSQPYVGQAAGQEDYPVMGFGPVGRWWRPRVQLAGTHDEAWKANQWPKSPLDHDYRYWNCAPADQQVAYPKGGEVIELTNLTPLPGQDGGPVKLKLPEQEMRLLVRLQVGAVLFAPMHIDTVILDFKAKRLSVVRRAAVSAKAPLRQLELGTWGPGTTMELSDGQKVPIPEIRKPPAAPSMSKPVKEGSHGP